MMAGAWVWWVVRKNRMNHNYTLGGLPLNALEISEMSNKTRKMKKMIFAIPAAAPAMPLNPRTAATTAMIKNPSAQLNISVSFVF